MIDIRKLKELVRLMVENDLAELDLRDQEETVTIKRGGGVATGVPMVLHPAAAIAGAAGAANDDGGESEASSDTAGLVPIRSPMVGTFYAATNPDAPPFVSAGSEIASDTVICLIEAMKVFNEIKAETRGVVERVLVNNGEAVEFGQELFLVRPT